MQWYVKLWIACNDIYGMWLSLIRIRIHCLHSPMKLKLACIPRTSYIYPLHTAQKNNMRCWKWFFMRNNDQRRQNIFFTLVLSVFFSNYLYHINRSNVSSYFIEFRFLFCSIFLFLESTKYILNDFSLILCVFHMNFSSAFHFFPCMAGHSSGPLWSMDVANKISTAARLWRLR